MKMMLRRNYFFLCFLIFALFSAKAQHYNFKQLSTKNGLANSIVQKIIQDNEGYIWFATQGGLSRFDGKKFKNFHKTDGLPSNDISCIYQDSKGNLWVATVEGLCKFDGIKFTVFSSNALKSVIYSIYEDQQKQLWFATFGSGLIKYDGKSFKQFTKSNGLPTDSLFSIMQDYQGNYWIGTYHFGVCKISKEDFQQGKLNCLVYTKKNGLSSNNIFCMLEIKPDVIWLGTTNGSISVIDSGKISIPLIAFSSPIDYIASLIKDSHGNIWIGTWDHGLIKYSNKQFTCYNEKSGLSSHLINSVFEDNERNIWIGTDIGINLFKNDAFITLNESDGLPARLVQCFGQLPGGNILCGTALGLCELNGSQLKKIDEIPDLANSSIITIATDAQGKIWIGTLDGVYICSYKQKLILEKKLSTYDNYFIYPVSKIVKSTSGKMYVSTFGNGLFVFDGNSIQHFGSKNGLIAESINSLFEDRVGNIWIAAFQEGAIKFDKKNFLAYSKKNGLSDNTVNGIAQDKKGNMLFATAEGGLSCFDGKKFHNYNEASGLLSNLISTVKVDKNNSIWLGTNKGLNKINLTDYYEVDTSKYFTDLNGLEGNEFGINSLFIDHKAVIWAGTTEGLTQFNTALDFRNVTPPNLVLHEIRLNYQKVNWNNYSDDVDLKTGLPIYPKLNYKNNHLTFDFQALTTDNNVKYRYKLEGLENGWSPSTTSTEAIYANIPSGRDYIFRVQAVNSDGVWSTKNIEYHFTIQSPVWQRWWFILVCLIALISGLFFYINYRTRRLAMEKRILEDRVEKRTLELKHTNLKLNGAFTDIKDSINYAQRIQQAILPVVENIREILSETFILFKPRDVVSGDFYWFGTVQKDNEVLHVIAAADCTGHGVPGAFMSMIGNTILNEIVVTKEITDPSEILSQLHKGVRKALKQNQNTSRDGMDICLCSINMTKKEVIYAGAFNPLWILRSDRTVEVIKATKTAIGGYTDDNQIFDSHVVQLSKGESIYLFTDGYADQFGGDTGKKLTTKKFRDTIISLHDKSMDEQGFYLDNYIEIWRGEEFQVDDILVIGIRV